MPYSVSYIAKTVVSGLPAHNNTDFAFTVTLEGDMLTAGNTYNIADETGIIGSVEVGRNNTVTLKNAGAVTILDLPEGAFVRVNEVDIQNDGFTADSLEKSATAVAGETHYINFTNTYDADDSDLLDLAITVNKILTDNLGAAADWSGNFEFRLQHYVNGADGQIAFKPIIFTEEGEYTFTVKEDASAGAKGITYDQTVCTVKVSVNDNGKGALEAEVVYLVEEDEVQEIEFVNSYTPEPAPEKPPVPSSPKTGDLSNIFAWAALMFISGGLVAVTSIMGKKKKAN